MKLSVFKAICTMTALLLVPAFGGAQAQDGTGLVGWASGDSGQKLRATIWVDPDGCEHWVMDGGTEGFMSQHLDRKGMPVCRGAAPANGTCKTFDSAALFKSGSATLNSSAKAELEAYFKTIAGRSVFVNGHTDDSGGADANLRLSLRRAMAVAKIAQSVGVDAEPRGFGEQIPIAPNDTAEGRSKNRRVELTCS